MQIHLNQRNICEPWVILQLVSTTSTVLCVLTLRIGQEDQAPDTGDIADDEADGQHHSVRHTLAQPAHEQESSNYLDATNTVHDAVLQLAEVKELLRQRSHHSLEGQRYQTKYCT